MYAAFMCANGYCKPLPPRRQNERLTEIRCQLACFPCFLQYLCMSNVDRFGEHQIQNFICVILYREKFQTCHCSARVKQESLLHGGLNSWRAMKREANLWIGVARTHWQISIAKLSSTTSAEPNGFNGVMFH